MVKAQSLHTLMYGSVKCGILALQAAGLLAILVAIAHGTLGELRVFANAYIEPQRTRTLLHLIFHASTVDGSALASC